MASSSSDPSSLSKALELIIKVAALITCVVGVGTLVVTHWRDADQSLDKKRELAQKDADLFYKQNDMQRTKEAAKADFLQKNLSLLTSSQPGAMRHVEALIDATFSSPDEILDVKRKARNIHESATELTRVSSAGTVTSDGNGNATGQFDYKARGFQYANAGYFAEAALSFGSAVTLAPGDIQAWNALAYAQLRQGNTDGAYASISRAIELKPTESNQSSLIAINAAKILCAKGNHDGARAYLNLAMDVNKHLLQAAKRDGELLRMCHIKFN